MIFCNKTQNVSPLKIIDLMTNTEEFDRLVTKYNLKIINPDCVIKNAVPVSDYINSLGIILRLTSDELLIAQELDIDTNVARYCYFYSNNRKSSVQSVKYLPTDKFEDHLQSLLKQFYNAEKNVKEQRTEERIKKIDADFQKVNIFLL